MKVVHYWPHLFFLESSGPGNSIVGWTRALTRLGIETVLVGDEAAVRVAPPSDVDHIFVKHIGQGHLRIPIRLPISEREQSLLVTHGGWTLANVVAGSHARIRGVPYIVMPHAVYDPHVVQRRAMLKRAWFSILEKPYLDRAAAIHIFFSDERKYLTSLDVHTPVVTAPNGIDPPPGIRWDGGSGGFILWLGRYDPMHKGLDVLLRGLSLMAPTDRPDLRLHGRDYHGGRDVVERLSHELDLESTVRIGDPIYGEEKWRLIEQAAGFVHPSRWEGSSIAVAEAISIGTPTLVAGYPMGRFLASQGSAILVDLTPAGVRDGIARLLSDEARAIGERGLQVARTALSWDALAKSWMDQVTGVLADAKR